jgi:hypothetical protein
MHVRTLALLSCLAPLLGVSACARSPAPPPIACGDVADVAAPIEKVTLWESSRLDDRTPKPPLAEGVRLEIHPAPGVTRAALEHALRCGVGNLGMRLKRDHVVDVSVTEDGLRYLVWARFSSRQEADRVVDDLRTWVATPADAGAPRP